MCVRYVGRDPRVERIQLRLRLIYGEPSVIEVFPGDVGAILGGIPERRSIVPARWGLQPKWADDHRWGKKNAYNARAETIWEKPAFREAIRSRRCLVSTREFYERAGGHWLRVSPEEDEPILMAAIYEPPNDLTDLPTYSLVTTVPNLRIAELHDRMPVVLTPEEAAVWLDKESSPDDLTALMVPCAEDRLRIEDAGPISRKPPEEEAPTLF